MTDRQLVEHARAGRRVITVHSRHRGMPHFAERPDTCRHRHGFRTIVCDLEADVIECPACGLQRVTACTFDEEFA